MPRQPAFMPTIAAATQGLLVMSETDAPIIPFVWSKQQPFSVEALANGKHVEIRSLEEFLRPYISEYEGQDDVQRANILRFRALQTLLESYLSDIQVYRVGSVQIDVYVLGRTRRGVVKGFKTYVVET